MRGLPVTIKIKKEKLIKLFVIESSELVQLGLRSLFRKNNLSSQSIFATSIEELLIRAKRIQPSVILLDLLIDNELCLKQIAQLINFYSQSKVLVLVDKNDEYKELQFFQLGVAGVISKYERAELLLKAIHTINNGQLWFSRNIIQQLWQLKFSLDQSPPGDWTASCLSRITKLSARQLDIACLVCKGLPSKLIAKELNLSDRTVRNILSVIYKKMNVKNRAELYLLVMQYNYRITQ